MSGHGEGSELGQEAFYELVEKLATISTKPAFLQMLREIEVAAPDEREATAMRLATLDGLRERDIQVDSDFRITTRYFENPEPSKRGDIRTSTTIDGPFEQGAGDTTPPVEAADTSLAVCFSVGAVVCASVGTSTSVGFPPLPPPIHKKPEHFDPN